MATRVTKPTVNVASWNLLYDNRPGTVTASQQKRCPDLIATLQALPIRPDFVGLYEVDVSGAKNCGDSIAKSLGFKHIETMQHNRPHEAIALTSKQPPHTSRQLTLDPGKGARAAIIAQYGGLTVVATHLIARVSKHHWRISQVKQLLDELKSHQTVIILGDFNCFPHHRPRKLLEQNGFTSVLSLLENSPPHTFPTDPYRLISTKPWHRPLVGKGISLDDIYIKNLNLDQADLFEGNSDHYGLWASLSLL